MDYMEDTLYGYLSEKMYSTIIIEFNSLYLYGLHTLLSNRVASIQRALNQCNSDSENDVVIW